MILIYAKVKYDLQLSPCDWTRVVCDARWIDPRERCVVFVVMWGLVGFYFLGLGLGVRASIGVDGGGRWLMGILAFQNATQAASTSTSTSGFSEPTSYHMVFFLMGGLALLLFC
jgi:hypothetical protein